MCETEIDKIKNVGISTNVKNTLTFWWSFTYTNFGWYTPTYYVKDTKSFSFSDHLRLWHGFAQDFKK